MRDCSVTVLTRAFHVTNRSNERSMGLANVLNAAVKTIRTIC